MTTEEMVDAVRDYLDGESFHYEYDAEAQTIKLGFNLRCKLRNTRVVFDFKKSGYLVYAFTPISAEKDNLSETIKYLTMANYGLINGNFELDVQDGEIRYKSYVNTEGIPAISKEIIDVSLDVCIFMLERYGNGLAAVIMGFSDAETEMKRIADSDAAE